MATLLVLVSVFFMAPLYSGALDVDDHRPLFDEAPSFHRFFSDTEVVMLLIDPDNGEIVDANRAAQEFYGYDHSHITAMTIEEINLLSEDQVQEEYRRAAREDRSFFIFRHRLSDGTDTTVEVVSSPYRFGDRPLLLSIIRDATRYRFSDEDLWYYQSLLESQVDAQIGRIRRLQNLMLFSAGALILVLLAVLAHLARTVLRLRSTEAELRRSNDVLHEVHHRIKNNMNTVVGLLRLEAARLADRQAKAALEDVRNRVTAMMKLYDTLYRSDDFESVRLDDYLPGLVREVIGHFPDGKDVTIHTEATPVTVDGKAASSLGIIVTELITNSMKYAFPGNHTGSVTLSVQRSGTQGVIVVEDDGIGLDGHSRDHTDGFGLDLVKSLVSQERGTLERESTPGKGIRYRITVPAGSGSRSRSGSGSGSGSGSKQ